MIWVLVIVVESAARFHSWVCLQTQDRLAMEADLNSAVISISLQCPPIYTSYGGTTG